MALDNTWKEASLSPFDLELDHNNDRIEANEKSTQEEIRLMLFEDEAIVKLANGIIASGGLMPGERLIVCSEREKNIVLEGNRRLCACQSILKPTLVPEKFRSEIKQASKELLTTLRKIKCDVAPNRSEAQEVITKRHTEPGIMQWSTKARMRRAIKLLDQGLSIEEVVDQLHTTKSTVINSIKEHKLLEYATNLGHWTSEELDYLAKPRIVTNPYTRFFGLRGVADFLKFSFDSNFNIVSKLPKKEFDNRIHNIARRLLVPHSGKSKPELGTRAKLEDVFSNLENITAEFEQEDQDSLVFEEGNVNSGEQTTVPRSEQNQDTSKLSLTEQIDSGSNAADSHTKTSMPSEEQSPFNDSSTDDVSTNQKSRKANRTKVQVFFENIACRLKNQEKIAMLCKEIKQINHTELPIASALLLRSLLEHVLLYQVKEKSQTYAALFQQLQAKKPQRTDPPSLDELLKFCANPANNAFTHKSSSNVLGNFLKDGHKELLNLIAHDDLVKANSSRLQEISDLVGTLITKIVAGEDL